MTKTSFISKKMSIVYCETSGGPPFWPTLFKID